MTIPAPHMAALKKSHKTDAGSVYGTKTVDGVNVACCFHIEVSFLPEHAGAEIVCKSKIKSAVKRADSRMPCQAERNFVNLGSAGNKIIPG